jgi:hypothetical protein
MAPPTVPKHKADAMKLELKEQAEAHQKVK